MEAAENLGAGISEIEGVGHRHYGEGARTSRQAEDLVSDRSDRDLIEAVAGEAVRMPHLDVVEIEFSGIDVVSLVLGDVVLSETLILFDTTADGKGSRDEGEGRQAWESSIHFLKLIVKIIVLVYVGAVLHGLGVVVESRERKACAVLAEFFRHLVGSHDDSVGVLSG